MLTIIKYLVTYVVDVKTHGKCKRHVDKAFSVHMSSHELHKASGILLSSTHLEKTFFITQK